MPEVPAPKRSALERLVREPLVHFLVVGCALVALERASGSEASDPRVIVVDDGVRRELADAYAHEHGGPPDPDQLASLVDLWIDDEVLYREGLAHGLDRSDARVHQRVASLMRGVVEAEHPAREPSETELRAYFDAHAERWAEDARIDFEQVFVSGETEDAAAHAEALRADLTRGVSPVGLGDTFSGGRRYRGRRVADLAEQFGEDFANGVDAEPAGVWQVHPSRFGLHVVRVERRSAASAADFERARLDVERDLMEEEEERASEHALEALRRRWEIVER
jgi:peptidyl-prolyl cis-trans isomerase C